MRRRTFLASTLALPTLTNCAVPRATAIARLPHRGQFRLSLKADAIGIEGSPDELLQLAIDHGYEALSVPAQWIEPMSTADRAAFAAKARDHDISWGANGLPVEFRQEQDRFDKDLAALPRYAAALQAIGVDRIGTWIVSGHDTLSYHDNLARHVERLRGAARVLGEHGIRLGMEYLGTQTLRRSFRHDFISSGPELRRLITAIGEPNVGVVLDSFHWWTAGESADDLKQWSEAEIVAVDLNDGNSQLSRDQQQDLSRELPGASGQIPIEEFVAALVDIGYTGPVRAEPFNATLSAMRNELAAAATIDALRKVTG